jgi:methylated-DNA-[protein]-cysteine S-methyltransferase
MMETGTAGFKSPIGMIKIIGTSAAVLAVSFADEEFDFEIAENALFDEVKNQLAAYFDGKLKTFDFPMQFNGSLFQQKVWKALLNIPYGLTESYSSFSKKTGDIKAIRAVASANGKNPFAIVVPCHRVIGSDGSLVGYAAKLWRKEWLLNHEAVHSGKKIQLSIFS